MRLASFRDGATERLGVVMGERILGVDRLLDGGPATMAELLAGGDDAFERLRDALRGALIAPDAGVAFADATLLAPVPRPGKVVAVGLNYHDHAAEGGRAAPAAPMLFAKFSTSVIGHGAAVRWDPDLTAAVDFEAELGVVIGRTARRIPVERALDHVAGYTCLDDVSARDLQFGDKQYVRGKSLDTFCPMGPVLVTTDEIPDPQVLGVRCFVNGERMQEATTADMIHGVAELVAFCSRAFTLEPGDVIATGTPSGVGWYREPRRLLRHGDEVVVEIDGIGRLVNRCEEERPGVGGPRGEG